MHEQSKLCTRKRKGLYFLAWRAGAKKLAPEDPGSGVREAKTKVCEGKRSDTEYWTMEVAADRYTRAQPEAPDEREIYYRLYLVFGLTQANWHQVLNQKLIRDVGINSD